VASDSKAIKAWRGVYSRGGGLSTMVQRGIEIGEVAFFKRY
jgi:hypothetical protein